MASERGQKSCGSRGAQTLCRAPCRSKRFSAARPGDRQAAGVREEIVRLPMRIARSIGGLGRWQDQILASSAFLLFPVLVLAPRGAVLVVCCAGFAAACLVWETGQDVLRRVRVPASFFAL